MLTVWNLTPLISVTNAKRFAARLDPRRPFTGHCFSRVILWGFVVSLLGATAIPVRAQPSQLTKKLSTTVSTEWRDQRLGDALNRLAATQAVTVWIDRRVDTHQSVEAALAEISLRAVFEKLAEQSNSEIAVLDELVYFGPRQTTRNLPGLLWQARQQVSKLPRPVRQRWLQQTSERWPRLSVPRALVEQIADRTKTTIKGLDDIPHDLWDEKSLPAMSLLEQLVLILAGFDLTCEFSSQGEGCVIVPCDYPVVYSRTYQGVPRRRLSLSQLREVDKHARIAAKASTIEVTGTWRAHRAVESLIDGSGASPLRSRPVGEGTRDKRFSLRLKNQPLKPVVEQLAAQLGYEVEWPAGMAASLLQQRVSCDVEQVDLEELLRTLLQQVGLKHRLEADRIVLQPRA